MKKSILLFILLVILISKAGAQEIKFDRFVELIIVPVQGAAKGQVVPKGMATAWQVNGKLCFTTASHVIAQDSYIEIKNLAADKFYGWAKVIGNVDSLGICVFILDTNKVKTPPQKFIEPTGSIKYYPFSTTLPYLGLEIFFKTPSNTCEHYYAKRENSILDKGYSGISDLGCEAETGQWYIYVFQRKSEVKKFGICLGFSRLSLTQLIQLINKGAYNQ